MYELGKGVLSGLPTCPGPLVPPLAAAVGNIASSAILVPKEVIKQRMQVHFPSLPPSLILLLLLSQLNSVSPVQDE